MHYCVIYIAQSMLKLAFCRKTKAMLSFPIKVMKLKYSLQLPHKILRLTEKFFYRQHNDTNSITQEPLSPSDMISLIGLYTFCQVAVSTRM